MNKLLCGDCKHPEEVHATPIRLTGRGRGIAWCRHPGCMCRGFVIDVEAEVISKTPS